MNFTKFFVVVLAALLLVACQPKNTIPTPDTDDTVGGSGDEYGSSQSGMDGSGNFSGSGLDDDSYRDAEALDNMIIYFDFDKADLRAEYGDILAAHANRLANDSALRVRLEGHADERGSREYNIGLGERRSQAVRRMLLIQGSAAEQISTVSFGEERPAAFGSDEESYTLNRRVEIKYLD